jgi:hypothetical protein
MAESGKMAEKAAERAEMAEESGPEEAFVPFLRHFEVFFLRFFEVF